MKRMIFFVSSMGDGGAQRVISILSEKMAARGMQVEILTYLDIPRVYEISEEVKLTCVEKCTGQRNIFYNLPWMRKYLKENAQVVLSFLAPFNMIVLTALLGTKTPIVVADRNDPAKVPGNPVVRKLRDLLYGFADRVIVQTNANKLYFKHIEKKTTVIYNPVDLKEYQGLALETEKERVIVSAGRLLPQKNQKMLLNAFKEISEKYPEYRLVIYGEGSYRKELENYVTELGISEKVLMPGSVTDLYDRIKSAELFVLSSDYEGMPNALIEAMCLGLPVISTRVSGAADLIKNRKNGLLVEAGAVKDLAKAMDCLLGDQPLREGMAREAMKLSEELKPDEILRQWLEVIASVS